MREHGLVGLVLYDGVYFSTYWNKVVQTILKISYTTLQIKLSLYHFSTLLEAYICHFMTMIPACRHNKTLLDRPRTHSTGPINPSSSRAPTTSSSSSTGKRAAERSDRGAIEEEADRPLHAVMAGSRGRWNVRQLAIACRYGGEEVTGFVCTIQEQVIPFHHHHPSSWVMHLYVCCSESCIPTTVFLICT